MRKYFSSKMKELVNNRNWNHHLQSLINNKSIDDDLLFLLLTDNILVDGKSRIFQMYVSFLFNKNFRG